MSKALYGIKVLDLTRLLPGAVCTLMLADMGADVVKIEDPNLGDYARWMPPMHEGLGVFFRSSNRNKRSMIIDLKNEAGQKLFYQLIEDADIVIEGFRPGVTERLNVGYHTLKVINPRIVYCSLSGWGQSGPYRDLSAHDANYLALNGVLGSMANPQLLGGQLADIGGSYVGVMGILAALFKRERTGEGDFVDVSLSESAMPFMFVQFVESLAAGLKGGNGTLTGLAAFYNVYKSSDGKALTLGAIEPKFWQNFCNIVGHPEWIAKHQDLGEQETLKQVLGELFKTKTAQEWHDLLADTDCCFAVVIPPEASIHDPQIQARSMAGIDKDGIPWMRSPVRLVNDDTFSLGDVPQHGEHTDEILEEIGLSAEEIARLHDSGALGKK
jgi:crotonobetainyl-CoA:carnitine CoA-transferase CaiB-like acyl-CoA transferase